MRWDIDRGLRDLEPRNTPGTDVSRVTLDVWVMEREGVVPTQAQREAGLGTLWCLSLGYADMPRAKFYAHTIHTAFLLARRAAKAHRLHAATPAGQQVFQPLVRRRAKVKRGESPRRRRDED